METSDSGIIKQETDGKGCAQTGGRIYYLNFLRFIAIVAVLLIHITTGIARDLNAVSPDWWWIGNIFNSMSRWAVPVFIMISGALLLDVTKHSSLKTFFQKRFMKVFFPFLLWSFFYYLWGERNYLNHFNFGLFLKDLIQNQVYYHLWFFYLIIGLYLITPILWAFIKGADRKTANYFFLLWFIEAGLFLTVKQFLNINIAISVYIVSHVGYFILGYYLNQVKIEPKITRIIYLLGGFSLATTIIGTYFVTLGNRGINNEYLYCNESITTMGIALAVFVFIKNRNWADVVQKRPEAWWLIANFSKTSFGIYLLHPFILEFLSKSQINSGLVHPLLGIPLTLFLCLWICFIIVWLLQKVPLVRYLFP